MNAKREHYRRIRGQQSPIAEMSDNFLRRLVQKWMRINLQGCKAQPPLIYETT
jgi:hypothetical protein